LDELTREQRDEGETIATPLALVLWLPSGPRVERLAQTAVVIGRSAPSDVVVSEATLSREHARVSPFAFGVRVEDLESKNGVHVRGRRVSSAELFPGDTCELGDLRVSVTSLSRTVRRDTSSATTSDALLDRLDVELAAARTFGRPLAIALVDAGARANEVLAALRTSLRSVDAVGMHDGARILVIVAQGDAALATRLIEASLGAARAGVATCPAIEADAHALLAAAREALSGATPGRVSVAAARTTEPPPLFAASPKMIAVLDEMRRWASSALPVLVLGETGSGKELVAREAHRESGRTGPFRAINCGAIPDTLIESVLFGHVRGAFTGATADRKGLFEEAARGTVFLDEIGELPLAAQVALLRVLDRGQVTRVGSVEERPVDARVIAATHRDVEKMVEAGTFRADLLYRLNALSVTLPPLRERPEDVLALADRFLRAASAQAGKGVLALDGAVTQALLDHPWPGNVRELRNTIERAVLVAQGATITLLDLPERVRGAAPLAEENEAIPELAPGAEASDEASTGEDESTGDGALRDRLREVEIRLILRALDRAKGNQGVAAEMLGLPKRTLVYKIARFGLRRVGRYEPIA
jgi:two-component system response regulator AtoC